MFIHVLVWLCAVQGKKQCEETAHMYELGVFALALIALIIIYKTNWWIPIPNKSKRGADI
jgi:hypothetical protein